MLRTIILRFRDITDADTISAHEEVIREAGYVWWGWWRKADEQGHLSELDQLQVLIRRQAVTIGIFDRSTSRFFRAIARDVLFRSSGDSIQSPEEGRTPSYYRNVPVAAWIKIDTLEKIEREVFCDSFGEVPIGNGTFFPVLSIGVTAVAPSAFVGEELVVEGNSIVHLSDLHFGADFGFPLKAGPASRPLLDTLVADINRLTGSSVGIVVVSGDFTTRAEGNVLLTDSLSFLKDLASKLRIQPQQVVLVPGNHDIPLREHEPYSYKHETLMKLFMKEFYGKNVEDFMQLHRFRLGGEKSMEILTMNSVRLRTRQDMNYGYIEWPVYEDFLSKHTANPEALRLAVLHHHLIPAPSEECLDPEYPEAGVSMTLDAGLVTEGLQSHGFKLVLHGHQHVPGVTKISRGRLQDDTFEIAGITEGLFVVGGGTTGSKRYSSPFKDNSYGIFTPKGDKFGLTVRRFNPAALPRTHFTATLSLGSKITRRPQARKSAPKP